MTLWAGIDEAGYGPMLGPLVVAATAFQVPGPPKEGMLWDVLRDAVTRHVSGSGGRLVVDDSKRVYGTSRGFRRLEEGSLSFVRMLSPLPREVEHLFATFGCTPERSLPEWFSGVLKIPVPFESNVSAVESKAAVLAQALRGSRSRMSGAWVSAILPEEFNRIVSRTGNKSLLLFQKCGLLLQRIWQCAGPGESFVLVDRHGGRIRYRRLLRDVFPDLPCHILGEGKGGSVYRFVAEHKTLTVAFKKEADSLALPVALASMMAKYVRELYMLAFNRYWQKRNAGLRPTAGYPRDAGRFIERIKPALDADGVELAQLVRCR